MARRAHGSQGEGTEKGVKDGALGFGEYTDWRVHGSRARVKKALTERVKGTEERTTKVLKKEQSGKKRDWYKLKVFWNRRKKTFS